MHFSTGDRVVSYEIPGLLGVSGVIEFRRARGLRLDRETPVATPPTALDSDPTHFRRHELEASGDSVADLSNTLDIRGIGTRQGVHVLVTGLFEAGTPRDRNDRDPLPVGAAVENALQVPSALTTAHTKSVMPGSPTGPCQEAGLQTRRDPLRAEAARECRPDVRNIPRHQHRGRPRSAPRTRGAPQPGSRSDRRPARGKGRSARADVIGALQ